MWEKEKLLVTSNFSLSHNVFKSCLLLMRQNEYLWSKGLNVCFILNSLSNDKILDWSKLTAFAVDKRNLNEKLKLLLGRVENIVGKKMLVTSIFSFLHNVLKRLVNQGNKKAGLYGKELNTITSFNPFPNKPWFLAPLAVGQRAYVIV